MKMTDMLIVSVDDHISEPPGMFDRHLSGKDLASAPKFKTTAQGTDYWEYAGVTIPSVALNAVAGRVPEEYGVEPTALSQIRKGCYDVRSRIDDMNANGIAASVNFGSMSGMDGSLFHKAKDRQRAVRHIRAYNDWHIDEWCGAYPGRFIPLGILPTWDLAATAAEIKRIAGKGCTAVSINENPTKQGLPSIHDAYWEPFWKAIAEHDMTICLHIGSGNPAPFSSTDTPIEAWITTMPMAIAVATADWLHLEALKRYPTLRVALSEGGIGWIPYFLERSDFTHQRHKAWTHSTFRDDRPSALFRRHFLTCFIDDAFGLKNLVNVGEDMVAYECDYPHSDSLWPESSETLWAAVKDLTDEQIDKVTFKNAARFFRFDLFGHHQRQELTVGALQALAAADKVDVTPLSSGGATPLASGEKPRVVTTGDIARMFAKQAQSAHGGPVAAAQGS
jgi:predicted TIM-barrel fold metal-dependent hydrolase